MQCCDFYLRRAPPALKLSFIIYLAFMFYFIIAKNTTRHSNKILNVTNKSTNIQAQLIEHEQQQQQQLDSEPLITNEEDDNDVKARFGRKIREEFNLLNSSTKLGNDYGKAAGILSETQNSIIDKARFKLGEEMKSYNFQLEQMDHHITGGKGTLDDFVLELGGQPLRNIIVTTWRSGSNFLGSILEQVPGTFFYTEPLSHHGWVQFRNTEVAEKPIQELTDLLRCNYTNLDNYVDFAASTSFVFDLNTRLGQYCQHSARIEICANPTFLSKMCKLFPIQAAKIVRMRLRLVKAILDDPKLMNVRVLYLVRDPRGIMHSRSHGFCSSKPDCGSAARLCSDLVDDYETAQEFREKYPNQFMSIRYEDLTLSPLKAVKNIFRFFQLEFSKQTEEFVLEHTTSSSKGLFDVFRVSKNITFRWLTEMAGNYSYFEDIQSVCSRAVTNWGYKLITDSQGLRDGFTPLGPPPWTDMVIFND